MSGLHFARFEWNSANEEHLSRHGVLPEETEEVLVQAPLVRRSREGKYLAFGQTLDGRYLTVVFALKGTGTVRVVTARDMDNKERRRFQKETRM